MSVKEVEKGEPRMPTTLPSPIDRGEFRFFALDVSGEAWRWVDEEMVWVGQQGGLDVGVSNPDGPVRVD